MGDLRPPAVALPRCEVFDNALLQRLGLLKEPVDDLRPLEHDPVATLVNGRASLTNLLSPITRLVAALNGHNCAAP